MLINSSISYAISPLKENEPDLQSLQLIKKALGDANKIVLTIFQLTIFHFQLNPGQHCCGTKCFSGCR